MSWGTAAGPSGRHAGAVAHCRLAVRVRASRCAAPRALRSDGVQRGNAGRRDVCAWLILDARGEVRLASRRGAHARRLHRRRHAVTNVQDCLRRRRAHRGCPGAPPRVRARLSERTCGGRVARSAAHPPLTGWPERCKPRVCVVQIHFNPAEISYAELLNVFFEEHNPTGRVVRTRAAAACRRGTDDLEPWTTHTACERACC